MKGLRPIAAGVGIFLFVFLLATAAMSENGRDYEYFLARGTLYAKAVNYLRLEGNSLEPLNFTLTQYLGLTLIDAFIFLFCLWLALLLLGRGSIIGREYLWLVLTFNLLWLVCLAAFQFCWAALSFLLLRLQPGYGPAVADSLTVAAFIAGVVVYVWLLARIFKLNFYGAVGALVLSHLIYALLVILFLTFIPAQSQISRLAKGSFGAKSILHNYLRDMDKVTSGESIFFPLRIRALHL